MKNKVFSVIALSVFLLAGCTTPSVQGPEHEEIMKVGILLPRSGLYQSYAADFFRGIDCFMHNYDKLHSGDMRPLELVFQDNESTVEGTLRGCETLIRTHQVDIILGPLTSGNSRPAIEYCTREKIPLIPLWATEDGLTASSDLAFRNIYSNSFTGFLLAKFSVENLRSQKAAVIYSAHPGWIQMKDGFVHTFEALNSRGRVLECLIDEGIDTVLPALERFNPDIIYLAHQTAMGDGGQMIKRIEEAGISTVFLADTDWSTVDPESIKGMIQSEIFYLSHYSAGAYEGRGRLFGELYREEFGHEPSGLAALGYEALLLISQAAYLKTAGSVPLEEILGTCEFSGLLGKIRFKSDGDAEKSGVFLKIHGGRTEYITTVVPEVFSLEEFRETIIENKPVAQEKPRITILNLEPRNISETDGLILTELISSSIIKTGRYQVIEAGQRNKILEESRFTLSGLTEENQIEIGRLLAAKNLVSGSISFLSGRVILNIRILDVETGETLFATYKVYGSLEEVIDDCDYFTYELLSRAKSI